jgi:serine kinase of HPr protein (carbohydrate metabolism regulator)
MGSLFAVLCHQRGLLPLHASAIATPQGAVAFLGSSGAGKSSIAAFLSQRGHRILADDICLIDPAAPRDQRVLPVAPWLKLWSTTLDALGESSRGLPRVFSDDEKYRYGLQQLDVPTRLAELILLERAQDQTETSFERLAPVHALHAVLDLTYQSWLVRAMGRTEQYFLRCGQALDSVRVTRMRRTWSFDAMETTLLALEAHLAENS